MELRSALQNITEINFSNQKSLITELKPKFEALTNDLRLGFSAAFLVIRTNIDDMFDEFEEEHINDLMNSLETLALRFSSGLFGKNLLKYTVYRKLIEICFLDFSAGFVRTFNETAQTVQSISAPAITPLVELRNNVPLKLSASIDDLRLGAGAIMLWTRVNLDDKFDDFEENTVSEMLDKLETFASIASKRFGNDLSKT